MKKTNDISETINTANEIPKTTLKNIKLRHVMCCSTTRKQKN